MPPPRSLPERTCVGCRVRGDRTGLVRLVRTPSGRVEVDRTGRAPGRGAYLHPAERCIRLAAKRGALAHALRTTLGDAEAGRLVLELHETVGDDR